MLDEKVDLNFRMISDGGYHLTNIKAEEVWLEKGKHFAKVEYNCGIVNNVGNPDWITAIYKIRYNKK